MFEEVKMVCIYKTQYLNWLRNDSIITRDI